MLNNVSLISVANLVQRRVLARFRHKQLVMLIASFIVALSISISAERVTNEIIYDDEGNIQLEKMTIIGEKTDQPLTHQEMLQAYEDHKEGNRLFDQKKYREAYPYLLSAAKVGFKDSQARLGFILLHGLGDVRAHHSRAIGWFSAAATGKTRPVVKRYYEMLMDSVPESKLAAIQQVVDGYQETYGRSDPVVTCSKERMTRSHIKRLRCFFTDTMVAATALENDDYRAVMAGPEGGIHLVGSDPIIPPPEELPSEAGGGSGLQ